MTRFELFDAVALKEAIPLTGGGTAGTGTPGAFVEVLSEGTAYMVELFGGWVQASADGSNNSPKKSSWFDGMKSFFEDGKG